MTDAEAPRAGRRSGTPDGQQVLREDADRIELLDSGPGGRGAVRVQGRTPAGREAVRAEMQLLAALEIDGPAAAPVVLETGEEGYVREAASPVRGGTGRRCATSRTPPTAERLATARARDQLDALVDALHGRGWVLGAPLGSGLGIRPDGSATVSDLTGLRPDGATSARVEDRMWVDSVLQDQERTLRRRIDAPSASALPGQAPVLELAGDGADGPEEDAPGEGMYGGDETDEAEGALGAAGFAPVPAVQASSSAAAPIWPAPRGRSRRLDLPGRRVLVMAAVAVLVTGGAIGVGTWRLASVPRSAAEQEPTTTAQAPAPSAVGTTGAAEAVPTISDPRALATQLARDRRAYLIGVSDRPVALEGTPARLTDDDVRRAYDGHRVSGGEPVVHGASISAGPTPEGTAQLRVEISTSAYEITAADGSSRSVDATAAQVVRLDLRWDGGTWRTARAHGA